MKAVPSCFFDKLFRAGYSPPPRGGVAATSRRYREASFEERTADGVRASPIGRSHQERWSLTSHISECVLKTARERPPRLRRFGGFATFSYWRSHPSSWEEGSVPPETTWLIYIRKTPNRVSSWGAFIAAEIPSASTMRVSAGSITPSSHRRAVL